MERTKTLLPGLEHWMRPLGELIVLATGGAVTEDAIKLAGIEHVTGKTLIDTTNSIAAEAPANGVLKYFTDINQWPMESIQQLLSKANMQKHLTVLAMH